MLRETLKSLPKTLDDTYARIIHEIDEACQGYALKALQWLTYSVRPLRWEELADALAIDVNDIPRFDSARRLTEPGDILAICSSLVSLDYLSRSDKDHCQDNRTCDPREIIVRLAHFSLKEYLISNRIQQGIAKSYSMKRDEVSCSLHADCLVYLTDIDLGRTERSMSGIWSAYPLAQYAVSN